eukprot:Pgem_evm1s10244
MLAMMADNNLAFEQKMNVVNKQKASKEEEIDVIIETEEMNENFEKADFENKRKRKSRVFSDKEEFFSESTDDDDNISAPTLNK